MASAFAMWDLGSCLKSVLCGILFWTNRMKRSRESP